MYSSARAESHGACRYEKFTGERADKPEKSNDPFTDVYTDLVTQINALTLVSSTLADSFLGWPGAVLVAWHTQKSDEVGAEKNRATKAALNAELR